MASFPYKYTEDGSWQDMTPDDILALKAEIESRRTTHTLFEIEVGGRRRSHDWEQERALIKALAEAGATW